MHVTTLSTPATHALSSLRLSVLSTLVSSVRVPARRTRMRRSRPLMRRGRRGSRPATPSRRRRTTCSTACAPPSLCADDLLLFAAAAGDRPRVRPRATDDTARSRATTRRVNEPKPVLPPPNAAAAAGGGESSGGRGRQRVGVDDGELEVDGRRSVKLARRRRRRRRRHRSLRRPSCVTERGLCCPAQRRAGPTRKVLHQPSTVPAFLLHEPVETVELLSAPTRLPGRRCGGDGGEVRHHWEGRHDVGFKDSFCCLQAGESSGLSCLQTRIEIECASARGERGGTCRGEGA